MPITFTEEDFKQVKQPINFSEDDFVPKKEPIAKTKESLLDTLIKGASVGAGTYGASKIIPPALKITKNVGSGIAETAKAFPTVLSYKESDKFATKVQRGFVQSHTNKVNEFGKELDNLSTKYPSQRVSFQDLINDIKSNEALTPEAKNIFNRTPYLKDMIKTENPNLPELTARQSQDVLNYLNTKIPKNIRYNNLDVLDAVNNIRTAQVDAFPNEMPQIKESYANFIGPYKNVKKYFGFNKTLDAIKNTFGGPQGQVAVEKVMPKELIDKMGGFRRAANFLDVVSNPFRVFTKKFLGVAPMVLDAAKFSQDPGAYIFEQETGLPKEKLYQAKDSLEKINRKEEITKEEVSNLVSLGMLI